LKPVFFAASQKLCFTRTTGQHKISEQSKWDRGNALKYKKPPPASDSQPMRVNQDEAGERSSHNAAYGVARQEQRERPRLFLPGKPIRQIQDYSRKIACLGHAKQNACNV